MWQKSKKGVVLMLALAVPGLIFVFLRQFGENKFDVPPLYEGGAPTSGNCVQHTQGPYRVPREVLNSLGVGNQKEALKVISFHDGQLDHVMNQLAHVFGDSVIRIYSASHLPADSIALLKNCYFFVHEPDNLVLVDSDQRIRGYYNVKRQEELDSLTLESRIILNH
jgi:hypothetical protein